MFLFPYIYLLQLLRKSQLNHELLVSVKQGAVFYMNKRGYDIAIPVNKVGLTGHNLTPNSISLNKTDSWPNQV